jgi:hypothetical protein
MALIAEKPAESLLPFWHFLARKTLIRLLKLLMAEPMERFRCPDSIEAVFPL